MTNYELQQLAVEWLREFARKNDAVAEGKHAARVLRLVDRILLDRSEEHERGWNAAIEAAAKACEKCPNSHDALWLLRRTDAVVAIRALAKPEPATAAPRHDNRECEAVSHGARGVADGKVCVLSVGHAGHHQSARGAMWDRAAPLDLAVKAALTGAHRSGACCWCGGAGITEGTDGGAKCDECDGTGKAGG
jgi:hypothetical protein